MGNDHYDVLVVGSGPGGATTAARVAETGKRVLLLERGDFLPRERDNWNSQAVFGAGKYTADETFYDLSNRPFQPELHYYVGGNSKVYGAALLRLMPADFGEVQHPNGVAPAWPLRYDDMEPFYVRAEHLFWVHGKHGEDPYAGFSSQRLQISARRARAPHSATVGRPGKAWPASVSHAAGPPAHPGRAGPGDHRVTVHTVRPHRRLPVPARCQGRRRMGSHSPGSGRASQSDPDDQNDRRAHSDGRPWRRPWQASEVTLPDGSPHTFTADIIVLSAGAILSAALLLNSANDKHPRGLANSSDMVGRNYMRHNNLALIAFSREPNPTIFQKTLSLNDFYGPSEEWEYPMGNIQMLGKSDDWQLRGAAPHGLGAAPSAPFGNVAKHSVDFWLSSEDIALPDSRVTVRPDGAIRLALQPGNNTEALTRLRKTFQRKLKKLGMVEMAFVRSLYLHKAFDAAATAHQAGTARFGTDPATSVLDTNCRAYDLDNLYVVDGSFMPSVGALNPTLTIIANALRVGDHIAERTGTTSHQQPVAVAEQRAPGANGP